MTDDQWLLNVSRCVAGRFSGTVFELYEFLKIGHPRTWVLGSPFRPSSTGQYLEEDKGPGIGMIPNFFFSLPVPIYLPVPVCTLIDLSSLVLAGDYGFCQAFVS